MAMIKIVTIGNEGKLIYYLKIFKKKLSFFIKIFFWNYAVLNFIKATK